MQLKMASTQVCSALLVGGLAAGDGAAEDFAQRGEGVAFMLGKGQQGAQRRGLHDRRVGGRFALGRQSTNRAEPASPLCQATRVLPKAMALVA